MFTVDPWITWGLTPVLVEAPSIIFIDELDAIGQKRSGGGELSGAAQMRSRQRVSNCGCWLVLIAASGHQHHEP